MTASTSRTRATASPPPTLAATVTEDWLEEEEEEEDWSVDGVGALEVVRALVRETKEELGIIWRERM